MFEILGINFYLYGLIVGLAVLVAMEISLRNRGNMQQITIEKAVWWTVISGVIGGRIYHVVDFYGRYYSNNFYKILYFWEGGLGIWGAIGGGLLGLWIYCYFNKLKYWKTLDILVIGVPLAQMIGRLGNCINGELLGKNGEPLFVYEGFLNLILFGIVWMIAKKNTGPGTTSGVYLIGYGVIRILLENFRPEEIIWKTFGVPVAMIFGFLAISIGTYLIFRKKQS